MVKLCQLQLWSFKTKQLWQIMSIHKGLMWKDIWTANRKKLEFYILFQKDNNAVRFDYTDALSHDRPFNHGYSLFYVFPCKSDKTSCNLVSKGFILGNTLNIFLWKRCLQISPTILLISAATASLKEILVLHVSLCQSLII